VQWRGKKIIIGVVTRSFSTSLHPLPGIKDPFSDHDLGALWGVPWNCSQPRRHNFSFSRAFSGETTSLEPQQGQLPPVPAHMQSWFQAFRENAPVETISIVSSTSLFYSILTCCNRFVLATYAQIIAFCFSLR